MIYIDKITLTNVVTYKNQTFDFQNGLTLVKGENRAGKSLLFSSLANLLYYSHPLADKKDPKALLGVKGASDSITIENEDKKKAPESSITLHIRPANNTHNSYEIKQKNAKDSVGYQIKENGVDIDARTIALAKEAIENIYNQPEDIFFTSTYLTSYRNHPLLHGSTAQRYEFFEKLFNFDFFDYVHKHFTDELKSLESKKVELDNLQSMLLELPTKEQQLKQTIDELNVLKKRREEIQNSLGIFTQLRLELLRLNDGYVDYEKEQTLLNNLINQHKDTLQMWADMQKNPEFVLKDFLTLIDVSLGEKQSLYNKILEAEKFSNFIKSADNEINQLASIFNIHNEELSNYIKESHFNISEGANLEGELKKINESLLNIKHKLQNKSLGEWKALWSQKENTKIHLLESLGRLSNYKEIVNIDNERFVKLSDHIATTNHKISEILSKLQKFSTLEHSCIIQNGSDTNIQCPTCFSALDKQQIKNYKETLQADLGQFQKDLTDYKTEKDLLSNILNLQKEIEALPTISELEQICEQKLQLEQQSTHIIKILDISKKREASKNNLENAQQRLINFKKDNNIEVINEYFDSSNSSSEIKKQIDILNEYLKFYNNVLDKKKQFDKKLYNIYFLIENTESLSSMKGVLNESNLNSTLPNILKALEGRIIKLTEENTSMQSSLTNHSVNEAILTKEINQLHIHKNKVDLLIDECKKIELVNKIINVFHPKGFRLEKIKYFTKVFESTLNKFAPYVFIEPFQFAVNVEKRDLQIIATRSNKSSDVRYLSGSESRCFQLLCLISILALLPQNKRTNICILDEMDAGCDEITTKMFYESFLPELRNIVPSIIVITPLKDSGFYINEDRSYMIKKVDGESCIYLL